MLTIEQITNTLPTASRLSQLRALLGQLESDGGDLPVLVYDNGTGHTLPLKLTDVALVQAPQDGAICIPAHILLSASLTRPYLET